MSAITIASVDRQSLRASASDLLTLIGFLKAAVADGDLNETRQRLEQIRDDAVSALEYINTYYK